MAKYSLWIKRHYSIKLTNMIQHTLRLRKKHKKIQLVVDIITVHIKIK